MSLPSRRSELNGTKAGSECLLGVREGKFLKTSFLRVEQLMDLVCLDLSLSMFANFINI